MVIGMEYLIRLVLLFFGYSFIGWCMEVTLKYIQFHRLINRGFFTGPICPIYGSGALLITLAMEFLAPVESAYGTTFAVSFVLCGAVEYLTSYFMEKRFHARWWDYSQKPMNLHGRVWIGNLILFGLGGVVIHHFTNPALDRLFAGIPLRTREIAAGGCLLLFAMDYVMTHFVLKLVRISVESSQADRTEEISREVRLLLSDRSFFYRRFAEAYPEVIYRTERVNARLAEIKAETERIREEAEQRIENSVRQISSGLEPASQIRNSLLSRQTELIDLLYDPETADDRAQELYAAIQQDQKRLQAKPMARISSEIQKVITGSRNS